MIKELVWCLFSLGGMVGLLSRDRNAGIPEPKNVAFEAGRFADEMLVEYKNRFCINWCMNAKDDDCGQ